MRKSFRNFLTSTVFILLSGFLLFQANATSWETIDSLRDACSQARYTTLSSAHFSPVSSNYDTRVGQILIEETESENLDQDSENDSPKPHFFQDVIIAVFQLIKVEHASKTEDSFMAYHTPALQECKRYIRFEDFRI
ncbi:hypothetical protein [Flavimarina sp. Hel_I_48]|uniref:hypothetical protein n=1 Tax=Flavimarina sp. Hel_I_48 TaxID=1392488 RepID=UPI0004DFA40D|nr:hypothetical protein [Flavimarina sp. Hel_I_48]